MNVEQRPLADPVSQNTITLVITAIIMASFLFADSEHEDRIVFIRTGAASMVVLHAILHLATLRALDLMSRNRFPGAEQALQLYRDPRRLSHFDLAAIWLGFFILVRVVAAPNPEQPTIGTVLSAVAAFT